MEPYEALSHLTKETLDYWAEKLALLTNEQHTGICPDNRLGGYSPRSSR